MSNSKLPVQDSIISFDLNTYNFELSPDRIAQYPQFPRENSRLLLVDRKQQNFRDLVFRDVLDLLRPCDVLVLNETRVFPARLSGQKEATGGRIEVLLLHPEPDGWACLVKPSRRARPGTTIVFGAGEMKGEIRGELAFPGGRLVHFYEYEDWQKTLERVGQVPLPPYIKRPPEPEDNINYQTVYARQPGSVAAPTAGLHFSQELLDELERKGVEIVKLVLHVGMGTFRPVEVADIREHKMHREYYELGEDQAAILNHARQKGQRIVAVGTTSVRTLETCCSLETGFKPGTGETGLFIYPGYRFKAVDALVTNFHLPRSSLLMLVYAFGGIELMRQAYQHAIDKDYRFFSYGDAMIID